MEDNNYPKPVESLIVILVVIAITYFFVILYGLYIALTGQEHLAQDSGKYLLLFGVLPLLILPYLYARLKGYQTIPLFRFKPIPTPIIVLSILIGVGLGIVGDQLDRLIQILVPTPEFLKQIMANMKAETWLDWLVLFAAVVLGASFSEELVFRGFLQVPLEQKGDVTRAVVMSSLAFTIFHANPFWAVQIFIMGMILGYLAWRTGSVIPGIIVHGVNNFLSLLYANYADDIDWYTVGNHVSPIILVPAAIILVYALYILNKSYKQETTDFT
jgi:membrane protease YdiL (CAAX protease family)